MNALTKAQDVIIAFTAGLEVQAYDFCYDNSVSIREAIDHDLIRFEDNTEVRVYISEDQKITILEA